MSIYVDLAKNTLELYLNRKQLPTISKLPKDLINKRAGCFVSIHTKDHNELRGCVGTILPRYKNLAGEIIANTISASMHDNRFAPITKEELNNLSFSIDVLEEPEAINRINMLNPKKYGLIVKSYDGREGLLLPNINGINTIDEQIKIVKEKAAIDLNEKVLMYRFKTKRFE